MYKYIFILIFIKLYNLIVIIDFNFYTLHALRVSFKQIQSALISVIVSHAYLTY